MSHIAVPPYVLAADDGSDRRVAFAVTTPGAFVLVESRSRGAYSTRTNDSAGVQSAIAVVKEYARGHGASLDALYAQLDRRARS